MHQRPRAEWSFPVWRRRPGLIAFDAIAFCALAAGVAWAATAESGAAGYTWHWARAFRYVYDARTGTAGPLLDGVVVTLQVCGAALGLALVFGLLGAIGRLGSSLLGRAVARGYVAAVRNTPLLVQIFVVYYVLGPILDLPRFPAAVLSLALFEGAYIAEIFRAGIAGVHRGQWEAALGLGLSPWQAYRRVVLPQAVRRVLPPLAGQLVTLVKDSALVSAVAVYDLTMQGRMVISETFLTFEIWFLVAGLYLVFTLGLSLLARRLELRMEPAA